MIVSRTLGCYGFVVVSIKDINTSAADIPHLKGTAHPG